MLSLLRSLLVQLQGMQVLVVSMYLTVNAQDSEVNNAKLATMVSILKQMRLPWLVVGGLEC